MIDWESKGYPSSHNHGSGKWDVSNIRFLSFGSIFHFHDYGRKGNLQCHLLNGCCHHPFPTWIYPSGCNPDIPWRFSWDSGGSKCLKSSWWWLLLIGWGVDLTRMTRRLVMGSGHPSGEEPASWEKFEHPKYYWKTLCISKSLFRKLLCQFFEVEFMEIDKQHLFLPSTLICWELLTSYMYVCFEINHIYQQYELLRVAFLLMVNPSSTGGLDSSLVYHNLKDFNKETRLHG